uniref:Alpha-(1,3)-fucosyltransferase FucT N-terminal domain-containing protein n=1 Tax=viral metagenome TaxID=1070528 RepID=A0A6C0K141_9ZZZZ
MRIGISFVGTDSIFDAGTAQAVFAIADACKKAGHDVALIGTLWSDAPKGLYPSLSPELVRSLSPRLDLLIDVDGRTGLGAAARVVALLRTDPSRTALEQAAYLSPEPPVDLSHVHQVWVWDEMVAADRLPLVAQLLQKPVKRVPYVWTPILLQQFVHAPWTVEKPYKVFVASKNTTNASSCVVPLIGGCASPSVQSIVIGNGLDLPTNAYFQVNIAPSLDKPVEYVGRVPYVDLSGVLVVSHGGWSPGLLDLLWLEVPLVHNCPLFKSYGRYYESDLVLDTFEIRRGAKEAVEAFGSRSWSQVFEKETRSVIFTDMWEGFKSSENFFLDLMNSADPVYKWIGSEEGSLLICGPFGTEWQAPRYASVPKVFFLGEPFQNRVEDPRLNLVLSHDVVEDATHMRLPLWPLFLDWFGSKSANKNPNQLPLPYAVKPFENTNKEFCAFVVSNPCCQIRNEAFDQLNAYKRVNSAGAYKNNLGELLFCKFGGGGGGDQAKFEFLKQHQFCICYENTQQPGYVTEKLLHAKLAGCVPLYWGSKEAAQDFDPSGFIDMDGKDIVEVVKSLEEHPDLIREIQRTPALDKERFASTCDLLHRVGKRLIGLGMQYSMQPRFVVPESTVLEYNPLKPSDSVPLFVSFATANFLPSLVGAIQSVEALRRSMAAIRFRAYLDSDVTQEQECALKERFDWITVHRLGEPPSDFPDMFEPRFFGWKLALLKEVCADPDLEGDAVIYADAGVSWTAMPDQMLQVLDQTGVCLVSDPTQINRPWCSPAMVEAMQVTDREREAQQLQAATIGFVAGSKEASALFEEAFTWGSKRECLFGDYAYHRHDQSILSVLSLRHKSHTIPLHRFNCPISLRKAYQKGTPAYHHHGRPVMHAEVLPGIDDIWVISLERRFDRWKSLLETHPGLENHANRLPAIDGQQLVLTQTLYNLFQKNDFRWKKSVMGCALSHILLWAQLASEHPSVQNYLILEDDNRFTGDWKQQLKEAMDAAPLDADLLLLGGVLPANLAAYPTVLEPVNRFWATVKPNGLFCTAQIDHFHFCAYSYVLSRRGATKLLAKLQESGCHTSIDHYLCHPTQGLKKYVLRNLITTCSQATNPAYQTAAFDEMLRVDSYDSDIWNNNACFDPDSFKSSGVQQQLQLWPIVLDLLSTQPHSIQTRNTVRESAIVSKSSSTVYIIKDALDKQDGTVEEGWLQSLWPSIHYCPFPSVEDVPPNSWLLVSRPLVDLWSTVCKQLDTIKKPFRLLHLSDENCKDPLDVYDLEMCTKVVRNYAREGLGSKVTVLPLGFAIPCSSPIPSFSERPLVWGFHGFDWNDRKEMLAPLQKLEPKECLFQEGFNASSDYSAMLLKSKFAPVPRGHHVETFRLWEALEHGSIPLYVRSAGDGAYWNWLKSNLSLMEIRDWAGAVKVIGFFLANGDKAERYRTGILEQWSQWKGLLKQLFV